MPAGDHPLLPEVAAAITDRARAMLVGLDEKSSTAAASPPTPAAGPAKPRKKKKL